MASRAVVFDAGESLFNEERSWRASSEAWGVSKPDRAFFDRVVEEVGLTAPAIAYVGDRLDNDVIPALERGMKGIFLRRGRWGRVHQTWAEARNASAQIDALTELPEVLERLFAES